MEKIYSYSKISCFEQCPLKFKFKYIDKIIPEVEKSIEAFLGDIIHKSLEWLYTEITLKRIPTIDDLIVYYTEEWKRGYSDEFLFNDPELSKEYYFNKGVEYLLNYYTRNYPFNDNTLEVEKKVLLRINEEILLQGFIDRLSYNAEKNEMEIHDYKTSGSLPEKNKIENDKQLSIYAIAIKEEFGKSKNISLIWHYLAYNKIIKIRKTNKQLMEIKKQIIEIINKIENTKEFNPVYSSLCKWCEFKDYCDSNRENEIEKYPFTKKYLKDD